MKKFIFAIVSLVSLAAFADADGGQRVAVRQRAAVRQRPVVVRQRAPRVYVPRQRAPRVFVQRQFVQRQYAPPVVVQQQVDECCDESVIVQEQMLYSPVPSFAVIRPPRLFIGAPRLFYGRGRGFGLRIR
jgi:hypothetical protein